MRDAPDGEAVPVEKLVVGDRQPRPSGPRFGTLVHAVFREVAWSGEGVPGLTRTQGRILGATAEEIEQAGEVVIGALQHPLLVWARNSKRVHRETPILLRVGASEVLEGTIDLLFSQA